MGGRRGYGATHSQSLEKHFLGIPGTRVLALHHRFDPAEVYDRLFSTVDCPVLVIENKVLYGERVSHLAPDGFIWQHSDGIFPVSRLQPPETPHVTIFCYGGMLMEAERAVDRLQRERGVLAEIICPIELYPLRIAPVLSSALASRRLLAVEEGHSFCGLGAEVLGLVQEHAPGLLLSAKRLGAALSPIPASKPAEMSALPSADSIFAAALEILDA